MMKRTTALCLAACLMFSLAGCKKEPANPLTEDMFKIAVDKQFKAAKERVGSLQIATLFQPPVDASPLLFPQNESGNAADLYWEVLKDRMDLRAAPAQQLVNETNAIQQVFDLALEQKLEISPATVDVVKAEAEKTASMPELEKFEAGAQRKYSRIIGESAPVPDNPAKLRYIPLSVIKGYMCALMAKAMVKEKAGDKAAAEKAMQTIVAVGQHISQDPAYGHFFTGRQMMKFGAVGLIHFHRRNSQDAKQTAAVELVKAIDDETARLGQLAARDDTGQPFNVLKTLGYLDEGVEMLARIAEDEKVPTAFRAGAIENMFSGYAFRFLMIERAGAAKAGSAAYDPPSDARLKAFERLTNLKDKALADMAAKSRQVLAKMKDLSNADRIKYWKELSA